MDPEEWNTEMNEWLDTDPSPEELLEWYKILQEIHRVNINIRWRMLRDLRVRGYDVPKPTTVPDSWPDPDATWPDPKPAPVCAPSAPAYAVKPLTTTWSSYRKEKANKDADEALLRHWDLRWDGDTGKLIHVDPDTGVERYVESIS